MWICMKKGVKPTIEYFEEITSGRGDERNPISVVCVNVSVGFARI